MLPTPTRPTSLLWCALKRHAYQVRRTSWATDPTRTHYDLICTRCGHRKPVTR